MTPQFLKKVFSACYGFFEDTNVENIARNRRIEIDWILEAGCHNGSDSVKLFNFFSPIRHLAFEPDETARNQAKKLFAISNLKLIELYPQGLSNINAYKYLKYEAEGKGSGSTHFGDIGEDLIETCVFDKHFIVNQRSGLMWLDVEGHALQALNGMTDTLQKIVIARIEVQLHTRNEDFVQDFTQVVRFMKRASLVPVFGPIYPGYFGDIIFLRSNIMTFKDRLRGKILWTLMNFLHLFLYPKLNRPSRIE